jgi:hypothetical protein
VPAEVANVAFATVPVTLAPASCDRPAPLPVINPLFSVIVPLPNTAFAVPIITNQTWQTLNLSNTVPTNCVMVCGTITFGSPAFGNQWRLAPWGWTNTTGAGTYFVITRTQVANQNVDNSFTLPCTNQLLQYQLFNTSGNTNAPTAEVIKIFGWFTQ